LGSTALRELDPVAVLGLQHRAQLSRVRDREVRVVDQRRIAVDDRVARDAERQRAESTQLLDAASCSSPSRPA
jgi:hypothetical protein